MYYSANLHIAQVFFNSVLCCRVIAFSCHVCYNPRSRKEGPGAKSPAGAGKTEVIDRLAGMHYNVI